MRIFLRLLRYLCYFALAVVGSAVVIVTITETFNLCPGFSANTGLSCSIDAIEGIANVAMGIVMLSLLSVVPALLAIAGLIFAIVDLVRWRRRAASQS